MLADMISLLVLLIFFFFFVIQAASLVHNAKKAVYLTIELSNNLLNESVREAKEASPAQDIVNTPQNLLLELFTPRDMDFLSLPAAPLYIFYRICAIILAVSRVAHASMRILAIRALKSMCISGNNPKDITLWKWMVHGWTRKETSAQKP